MFRKVSNRPPSPESSIGYCFVKAECKYCHRKVLVEYFVNGSNHTVGISTTCARCIPFPLQPEFIKAHPSDAKEIEEWVKSEKPDEHTE
jgi:hypothetical protein